MKTLVILVAATVLVLAAAGLASADFVFYTWSNGGEERHEGYSADSVEKIVAAQRKWAEDHNSSFDKVILACRGAGWIAVSKPTAGNKGNVGVACGSTSKERAIVGAVQECRKTGSSGCEKLVGFGYDPGTGLREKSITWAEVDPSSGNVTRVIRENVRNFPWYSE